MQTPVPWRGFRGATPIVFPIEPALKNSTLSGEQDTVFRIEFVLFCQCFGDFADVHHVKIPGGIVFQRFFAEERFLFQVFLV